MTFHPVHSNELLMMRDGLVQAWRDPHESVADFHLFPYYLFDRIYFLRFIDRPSAQIGGEIIAL
jgi:hypothetical protein